MLSDDSRLQIARGKLAELNSYYVISFTILHLVNDFCYQCMFSDALHP